MKKSQSFMEIPTTSSPLHRNVPAGEICLEIAPTTGGTFDFRVRQDESIDNMKKSIAKKLKVSKEQICLLHRDRLLQSGQVSDYGLADGSRISLVPSVETGLLTQRPEQSVLEALEGLNDSQVGDFLSGKSPLNLTMRLGDHVMLIQLQLSKGATTEGANSQNATPEGSSLAEASRNLTNTLKKLSNHVTRDESITNHMQHHGKGVYSGTFSGTLNPALQDGLGKPRRHVSTIVHILNDLLGGMEPKKRPTSSESSSSSSASSTSSKASTASSSCSNDATAGSSSPSYSIPSSPSSCSSKCSSAAAPESKKPRMMSSDEKELENEQLRLKVEQLKESLRARKEKVMNK